MPFDTFFGGDEEYTPAPSSALQTMIAQFGRQQAERRRQQQQAMMGQGQQGPMPPGLGGSLLNPAFPGFGAMGPQEPTARAMPAGPSGPPVPRPGDNLLAPAIPGFGAMGPREPVPSPYQAGGAGAAGATQPVQSMAVPGGQMPVPNISGANFRVPAGAVQMNPNQLNVTDMGGGPDMSRFSERPDHTLEQLLQGMSSNFTNNYVGLPGGSVVPTDNQERRAGAIGALSQMREAAARRVGAEREADLNRANSLEVANIQSGYRGNLRPAERLQAVSTRAAEIMAQNPGMRRDVAMTMARADVERDLGDGGSAAGQPDWQSLLAEGDGSPQQRLARLLQTNPEAAQNNDAVMRALNAIAPEALRQEELGSSPRLIGAWNTGTPEHRALEMINRSATQAGRPTTGSTPIARAWNDPMNQAFNPAAGLLRLIRNMTGN